MITDFNIYFGLMINGLFTGIGVIIGQWIWNGLIQKRINRIHKKIKGINGKLRKRRT